MRWTDQRDKNRPSRIIMALTPDIAVYFSASFRAMNIWCGVYQVWKTEFLSSLAFIKNMELACISEYLAHMLCKHQMGACAWWGIEYHLPYGIVLVYLVFGFFFLESQWQCRVTGCHIARENHTLPLYYQPVTYLCNNVKATKADPGLLS